MSPRAESHSRERSHLPLRRHAADENIGDRASTQVARIGAKADDHERGRALAQHGRRAETSAIAYHLGDVQRRGTHLVGDDRRLG